MDPPTSFTQKRYPEGRKHTWSIPAAGLRKYVEPPAEPCPTCGTP